MEWGTISIGGLIVAFFIWYLKDRNNKINNSVSVKDFEEFKNIMKGYFEALDTKIEQFEKKRYQNEKDIFNRLSVTEQNVAFMKGKINGG